jgi:DNA repair protein RadC
MNLFSFNEIKVSYTCKRLGPEITNSRAIFDLMQPNWLDIEYTESFYVILLNRGNKVIGVSKISTGSVSGTIADPKKMFQIALKANASALILCHNHPSGNTRPSQNDTRITRQCVEAGKFLDLPVLDHIIVTRAGYFSFADEGML